MEAGDWRMDWIDDTVDRWMMEAVGEAQHTIKREREPDNILYSILTTYTLNIIQVLNRYWSTKSK